MKNSNFNKQNYSTKTYKELIIEAEKLVANSEYSKSIDVYSFLRNLNKDDVYILYELANSYFYMKSYKEAIPIYLEIIEIDKGFLYLSRLLLGKSYKAIGEIQNAIDTFEYALTHYKQEDMSKFMLELGWIYYGKGEYKISKSMFKSLLLISTNYSGTSYYYLALISMEENKDEEAIENLKLAINESRSISLYHYDLADLYAKKKDYDNAILSYNVALELNPKHQKCLYSLLCLYQKIEDSKNAKDCDDKLRSLISDEYYSNKKINML